MRERLKMLLDGREDVPDIVKAVLDLRKHDIAIGSSVFTLVEDVVKNKERIFRIEEPIKSKRPLTELKFLEEE